MFVKSIMIPKYQCQTVGIDEPIGKALDLMNTHNLDALPMLDGDLYVGTITRFRIYERFFNFTGEKADFMQGIRCEELAGHVVKTISETDVFEDTLFEFKDFPQLTVVDDGQRFRGLVTRHDVLEQFESAFGMNVPGVRLSITSVEGVGRLAKLAEITKSFDENIISMVTFDASDKLVRRMIIKVVKSDNLQKYIEKLEDSGLRVLHIHED